MKTGVILSIVSAIAAASVAAFTKTFDMSAWQLIFWRGIAGVITLAVYLSVRSKWHEIHITRGVWIACAAWAGGTSAYIPSLQLTSVTNVSVIFASVPIWGAVLAWFTLKEWPKRREWIAASVIFVGIILLSLDSLRVGSGLLGDILAVWMTLMMALAFVVFRIWPDTSPASATLLSTIVVILIAGTCDIPQIPAAEEIPSLFLYGSAFAVMSITMGEAALRLPAITVGLLSLIEVPLAPIFAFLLITEIPSFVSVAVGTVVLLSVIYAQSGKQDF